MVTGAAARLAGAATENRRRRGDELAREGEGKRGWGDALAHPCRVSVLGEEEGGAEQRQWRRRSSTAREEDDHDERDLRGSSPIPCTETTTTTRRSERDQRRLAAWTRAPESTSFPRRLGLGFEEELGIFPRERERARGQAGQQESTRGRL